MKRILIVEDEPRFASFLEKGLTANGYTTKVVGDGVSAGAVADDEEFDLMILDLGLPDMDGIHVLRMVRQRGVSMPVIILTARDDMSDKVVGTRRRRLRLHDEAVQPGGAARAGAGADA